MRNLYRIKRLHNQETSVRVGRGVTCSNPIKLTLGKNSVISDNVRIKGNVSIGENTRILNYSLLDAKKGEILIGDRCSLNDYSVIYGMGGIYIGNDVRIATHTVFVSGNHDFSDANTPIRLQQVIVKPINVEDDVWIGANCTILSGVTIGKGSIIGAGSVVTKDIPPLSVAVGSPAKVIKKRSDFN